MQAVFLTTAMILAALGPPVSTDRKFPPEQEAMQLLVPAYFYPSGSGREAWDTLISSARTVPLTAIVNPASGPGKAADENYRQVLADAAGSKLQPIGYVTLSYAKRSVNDVKADIDQWLKLYPSVQGIFFDEQPSGPEQVAHVGECFAHARKRLPKGLIVSNPGVPCDGGFASLPEKPVICLFEHHMGWESFRPSAWVSEETRGQVYVLPYGVETAERMHAVLEQARSRHTGWIYITDAAGKNPWNRLPTYWSEEVRAVHKAASRK